MHAGNPAAYGRLFVLWGRTKGMAMEPAESVQLARLTAMFESSIHVGDVRHKENVDRLVRIETHAREIENQARRTNGRVDALEVWQDDVKSDADSKPLNVLIKWGGVFAAGFAAAWFLAEVVFK